MHSVQLYAKYRQGSAIWSPYHQSRIKEVGSLKVKGPLYSCLLIAYLPSGSRIFGNHLYKQEMKFTRIAIMVIMAGVEGLKMVAGGGAEVKKTTCTKISCGLISIILNFRLL